MNDGHPGRGADERRPVDELSALDPAAGDAGYWERFHRAVALSATAELSRRRRAEWMTVSDVVASWWRALVPAAAVAVAVGAITLVTAERTPATEETGVAVEEVLVDGVEGEPIPSVLATDAPAPAGAFLASEAF